MHRPSETADTPLLVYRVLVLAADTPLRAAFWDRLDQLAPDLAIDSLARPTSFDRKPDLVVWPVCTTVTLRDDLARLNARFPRVPVIAVSDPDDARLGWTALRHGCRGYLPSTASPRVAAAGLRLVLAGGLYVPGFLLEGHALLDDPDLSWRPAVPALTGREAEVLQRLKRGLQNKLIAHELGISQSTVKVHVRSIMRKTAATNRTQIVCLTGRMSSLPLGAAPDVGA